jgi:hypothetical protein
MRSPWRVLLGVLCIALVLVGGILAATHTHAKEDVSHQDCSLCVTAHMTAQVAVSVTQVLIAQVFTRIEASRPVDQPQFIPQFALYSRPPPADLNRS